MKKVIKKTISMFLSVIVILLVALNLTAVISRKNNYGVARYFGYGVLEVMTDSMEPTLKVGTLVFVKQVDPKDLVAQVTDESGNVIVEGDVITFYRTGDAKVVTHRLLSKTQNSDGSYILECFGDNLTSSQCTNNDCSTYPHDIVNSKYLIGKVVAASYSLGKFHSAMSNSYLSLALIIIPGTYVIVSTLIDFLNESRRLKLERDAEEKRIQEGGLSREEELQKLKEELKEQLKKELNNEKEDK